MPVEHGPYFLGAPAYIAAGWSGILPLAPATKGPPPPGWTGDTGGWPSGHQIQRWRDEQPTSNIALRMPLDVIGIDLDAYKDPEVRAILERICGPLPPTWVSTSRPGTDSGIRLYRVPVLAAGETWRGAPVPACEIIQHRHRYAVVAPSVHPEGRPYLWIDERSGEERLLDPPEIDDLAELPWAAIAALKVARPTAEPRPFAEVRLTDGAASAVVEARLRDAVRAVSGHPGGRHDAACAAVAALVRLAERGEPGVDGALEQLGTAFVAAVGGERPGGPGAAAREYAQIVVGAQQLIGATAGRIPTKAERELEASGRWQMQLGPGVPGSAGGASVSAPPSGESGYVHTPDAVLTADGVVELDDLLAGEEDPYDWLIDGLIERGDRVIVTGLEGRGKSTLLRQFAVRVASGMHPFDTDATIAPLRVLYVDLENSRRQTRRKITDLRRAAADRYAGLLEFAFRPEGIDLTRTADVAWLTTVVHTHAPDLVIIGPIYKMSTGDPKDEQDAKVIASTLDQLRTAYGFAMLIEAHTPYADGGAKSKRPERPYGASLWSRWPEFGIFLGPEGDLLHWRGQRDERQWPLKLRRGGIWPWEIERGHDEVAAEKPTWDGPTQAMTAIIEFLDANHEVEFTQNQMIKAMRALGSGFKDRTLALAGEKLALEGKIDRRSSGRGFFYRSMKRAEMEPRIDLFAGPRPPRPTAAHRGPAAVEGHADDRGHRGPHTPNGVGRGPRSSGSTEGTSDTTDRGPTLDELLS